MKNTMTIEILKQLKEGVVIEFDYVNYRGVEGKRKAKVLSIYNGETEYHHGVQMLLKGIDLDKNAERTYAVKDMNNIVITE